MTPFEKIEQALSQIGSHIGQAHRSVPTLLENEAATMDTLRACLSGTRDRVVALWACLLLPEMYKRALLPELVDLCSVGHSDIGLCRTVLLTMDRVWLSENIGPLISVHLDKREAGEEEYRRFAELLTQIDASLLSAHVERALAHPDPEIREVGEDFAAACAACELAATSLRDPKGKSMTPSPVFYPHHPIDLVLEIIATGGPTLKVLARCGKVIESYYNMNRRSLQSKRVPHHNVPTTAEGLNAEEERYLVYMEMIEDAHRMVREHHRDHAKIADMLEKAAGALDTFRPCVVLSD